MNKTIFQTMIAYAYHAIFIFLAFLLMNHYYDAMFLITFIAEAIYFIYWIAVNRKTYMPWIVYLHFLIGAIVELVLHWRGIIPGDGGFLPGLAQFCYIWVLVIYVVMLGVANFILWFRNRNTLEKRNN